jgi:hypothetical protein
LPAATEHAVDRLGEADTKPLHAARQRPLTLGLDEQMHVIALHRPLDQSYAEPVARGGEHAPHDLHAELRTEIRQASPKPQRHVHGRGDHRPAGEPDA